MKVTSAIEKQETKITLTIVMTENEIHMLREIIGPSSLIASRDYMQNGQNSRRRTTNNSELIKFFDNLLYNIYAQIDSGGGMSHV